MGSLERLCETAGTAHELRRGTPFCAERCAGRMRGIGSYGNQLIANNAVQGSAPRAA
jgi:hypothetical protein